MEEYAQKMNNERINKFFDSKQKEERIATIKNELIDLEVRQMLQQFTENDDQFLYEHRLSLIHI